MNSAIIEPQKKVNKLIDFLNFYHEFDGKCNTCHRLDYIRYLTQLLKMEDTKHIFAVLKINWENCNPDKTNISNELATLQDHKFINEICKNISYHLRYDTQLLEDCKNRLSFIVARSLDTWYKGDKGAVLRDKVYRSRDDRLIVKLGQVDGATVISGDHFRDWNEHSTNYVQGIVYDFSCCHRKTHTYVGQEYDLYCFERRIYKKMNIKEPQIKSETSVEDCLHGNYPLIMRKCKFQHLVTLDDIRHGDIIHMPYGVNNNIKSVKHIITSSN